MPQFVKKPTLITIKANVKPDAKIAFADWQARLNAAIPSFPGFIILEFISPSDQEEHWSIIQRFKDADDASQWRESLQCKEIVRDLSKLTKDPNIQESVTD